MPLDSRNERRSTSMMLAMTNKTGEVPEGFSLRTGYRRIEKDTEGFMHTPLYQTGDKKLDVEPWPYTGECHMCCGVYMWPDRQKGVRTVSTAAGDVLYPNCRFECKDSEIIDAEGPEGRCRIAVPRIGGILFGLLGPDGKQESAPVSDLKKAYGIFINHNLGMMLGELCREESLMPSSMLPPLVPCGNLEFFPQSARDLSEKTLSIHMAIMAVCGREKPKPRVRRFSGNLPDGTAVDGWTAEMLMQKMNTYIFGPFPARDEATKEKGLGCWTYCFMVPAFSMDQARIIFAKRILEYPAVLYRGKPLYGLEAIRTMGFNDIVWDEYCGKGKRLAEMPPIDSIPCTGMRKTRVIDFFQTGIWPLLRWSRDRRERPFVGGKWTSDDLGFAFSILIARELGLHQTTGSPPDSPYAFMPRYSDK